MKTDDCQKCYMRVEEDALGSVEVPGDHLWGAQTQRSHLNFPIGVERYQWGRPVIRALGILKKCAALANEEPGQLARQKVELIVRAAQEVIEGKLDGEFPLVVFQIGSGTQTNTCDVVYGHLDVPDSWRYREHGRAVWRFSGRGTGQTPAGGQSSSVACLPGRTRSRLNWRMPITSPSRGKS